LRPYHVERFEHKYRIRQPGEPVWSTFNFENTYEDQPLQFIITTTNKSSASNLFIEIDDFKKIDLDITIGPNQNLKYDGGNDIVLYDKSWNEIKSISINPDKFILSKGSHEIKIDCKFDSTEDVSLKLELKTIGSPELVSLK
jgi:hypothetical protein